MIKQIVASINRHEELLLELIAERFQSRWQQATEGNHEGDDAEDAATENHNVCPISDFTPHVMAAQVLPRWWRHRRHQR